MKKRGKPWSPARRARFEKKQLRRKLRQIARQRDFLEIAIQTNEAIVPVDDSHIGQALLFEQYRKELPASKVRRVRKPKQVKAMDAQASTDIVHDHQLYWWHR